MAKTQKKKRLKNNFLNEHVSVVFSNVLGSVYTY